MVVPYIIALLAVTAQLGDVLTEITTPPAPSSAEGTFDNAGGTSNLDGAVNDTTSVADTATDDSSGVPTVNKGQTDSPTSSKATSTVKPVKEKPTANQDTKTEVTVPNRQPGDQATEANTSRKIDEPTTPANTNATDVTPEVTTKQGTVTEHHRETTEKPNEPKRTNEPKSTVTAIEDDTKNTFDVPGDSKSSTTDTLIGDQRYPVTTSSNNITTASPNVNTTSARTTHWIDIFINIHHFDGWYTYGGTKNRFDFVMRYVHPNDDNTLVANLHDETGAILEMNGTSNDEHRVTFTLVKLYTATIRFPINQPFEITGIIMVMKEGYRFSGNITKPENSPFKVFSMTEGKGYTTSSDGVGTKLVFIVAIPATIGFLGILGTVWLICWASRKGYLRKHKTYKLFRNSTVAYESVAETVHI